MPGNGPKAMPEHRRGGVDAAGAPFQLALREPCVRAPVRRTALVMLQHHSGRSSYRRHEHKALKTHHMFPDGLLDATVVDMSGSGIGPKRLLTAALAGR